MSAEEDIKRPILPAEQEEEGKKGLLGIFSKKKEASTEADMLKDHLREERPGPSVQAAFEEQAARDDIPPPPPEQTLIRGSDRQPSTTTSPSPAPAAQPRTIKDLEAELAEAKGARGTHEDIRFNVMGGKRAVTLTDLQKVIMQMPPEEFERHHHDKEFSLWIRSHLFDPELATTVQRAANKQEALAAIEEELKPRVRPEGKIAPPPKTEDHVEDHFGRLQHEHDEGMRTLQRAIAQPRAPATKDYLEKALKTKAGKVADDLESLSQAITLLDEETYKNMVATRKEDLAQRISELARTAAKVSALDPATLQAGINELLSDHKRRLDEALQQEKDRLSSQAAQLLDKEDEVARQQEDLRAAKERLDKRLLELGQQRAAWEEEAHRREDQLTEKETGIAALLQRQEETIAALKQDFSGREEALRHEREGLEEQKAALRGDELRIAQKKREELQGVEEEKELLSVREARVKEAEEAVEEREAALAEDKRAFEESMRKREELVQQSVDRIIKVDEDINQQRENVARMRRELDTEGFKKYLQSTLREVRTDHIPFKPTQQEKDVRRRYADVYGKIDACNQAIEEKRMEEARALYTELKRSFEEEHLPQEEKDILFDAIRELYANLHLALLDD